MPLSVSPLIHGLLSKVAVASTEAIVTNGRQWSVPARFISNFDLSIGEKLLTRDPR